MSLALRTDLLVEGTQSVIWGARAASLAPIGLKCVDEGEYQIPAPDQLSTRLPQVVVVYVDGKFKPAKQRSAVHAVHELHIKFIRLLGDTEAKNTLVRQHGELIAKLFLQPPFPFPVDSTRLQALAAAGVRFEMCWAEELQMQAGFMLDKIAEVEEVTIPLKLEAMHYKV